MRRPERHSGTAVSSGSSVPHTAALFRPLVELTLCDGRIMPPETPQRKPTFGVIARGAERVSSAAPVQTTNEKSLTPRLWPDHRSSRYSPEHHHRGGPHGIADGLARRARHTRGRHGRGGRSQELDPERGAVAVATAAVSTVSPAPTTTSTRSVSCSWTSACPTARVKRSRNGSDRAIRAFR
jgi:hypothetical protein